jgi:polyhydroxyalkanoate synthesis regulator phasin
LEQYRSLSQAAERYETQAHHLESEGSNMKLELLTRDSEIRRLREKVDSLERQVEEVGIIYIAILPLRKCELSNFPN